MPLFTNLIVKYYNELSLHKPLSIKKTLTVARVFYKDCKIYFKKKLYPKLTDPTPKSKGPILELTP